MAVNLIEDRRVVYHDEDGDTLEVKVSCYDRYLYFDNHSARKTESVMVVVYRDAVETLRDCLSRWLETGQFTTDEIPLEGSMQVGGTNSNEE